MVFGLVLASGGARGAYQAGAILRLSERGARFNCIAGTSIGALNGAFYAQGDGSPEHAAELCDLWRATPDANLIQLNELSIARIAAILFSRDLPIFTFLLDRIANGSIAMLDPRPVAALLDDGIDYEVVCRSERELVITMLKETDPIVDIITAPWREISTFTARELGAEQLRTALLASAAIPLAFPAQEVEGQRYGDAGIAAPLPIQALYDRGARRIVSVSLADDPPEDPADYPEAMLLQIIPAMDIGANPATTFDFSSDRIEELIALGYADTNRTIEENQDLWERMIREDEG